MNRITYTIYTHIKPPRIGLTFPHTPSITLEEIDQLIEQLNAIRSEAEDAMK